MDFYLSVQELHNSYTPEGFDEFPTVPFVSIPAQSRPSFLVTHKPALFKLPMPFGKFPQVMFPEFGP